MSSNRWLDVSSDFFDILEKHDNDYLMYMTIWFESGYIVTLDYMVRTSMKIVVDYKKCRNNGVFLLESCGLNDGEFHDKYLSLHAMLMGNHYDDCVTEIFLAFGGDEEHTSYKFDGEKWLKSVNEYANSTGHFFQDLGRYHYSNSDLTHLRSKTSKNAPIPHKNNENTEKPLKLDPEAPIWLKDPEPVSNKNRQKSNTVGHTKDKKSNTDGGA